MGRVARITGLAAAVGLLVALVGSAAPARSGPLPGSAARNAIATSSAGTPASLAFLAPGYYATSVGLHLPAGVGIGGVAVRSDGSLVVWPITASGQAWDEHLHLLPAAGGVLGPDNRFGPALTPVGPRPPVDYRSLAFAGGRLWALGTAASGAPHNGQTQLWELDPQTGALDNTSWIAAPYGDHADTSAQQITPDPTGGGVLVIDYNPPLPDPLTPPTPGSSSSPLETYEVQDVSADGARHLVYQYQGGGGCTGTGSGQPSVGPQPSNSCDRWLYPRSLAVGPGGSIIAMGEEGVGADPPDNDIEGFNRGGQDIYTVTVPWPDQYPPTDTPSALAFGTTGCLAGNLYYGVDDQSALPTSPGDLFVVSQPGGFTAYVSSEVAAPQAEFGAPSHYGTQLALAPDGDLVFAAWSDVFTIGCTPAVPAVLHRPVTPAPGAAGHKPPAPGGAGTASGSRGAPLSLPGPPSGPAPAPAPVASLQSSSQAAAQASSAPNAAGLADVAQDEPAMAMPAVGLPPGPGPEAAGSRLWAATLALTGAAGMGAIAVEIRRRRDRSVPALGEVR